MSKIRNLIFNLHLIDKIKTHEQEKVLQQVREKLSQHPAAFPELVVTSSEKSQHVNRDKAMQQLKIRIYEKEKSERDAERAEARASQVGSGDRSEKIRTYNYPENRVTDHRIGLTLYALDKVIAGDKLEDVVSALMTEDQARRLAAMEDS